MKGIGWRLLLLLFGIIGGWTPATAALETQAVAFDRYLDIEIFHGYPYDINALEDQVTAGFMFRNSGAQRRLQVIISGDVSTTREVLLPPGEARRLFIYLPHITTIHSLEVMFRDSDSGQHTQPQPLITQGDFSSNSQYPQYALARLGPIAAPINVAAPWNDMGMIEPGRQFPDHWRGLTGLTAVLADYRQLASPQPWQRTLVDWVTMGGILLVVAPPDVEFNWQNLGLPLSAPSPTHAGPIRVGLGHVSVVPAELLAKIETDFLGKIGINPTSHHDYQLLAGQSLDYVRGLLPQIGQVPRWELFLVLAGFAILIGPVGWNYLVKKKSRPFTYLLLVMGTAGLFSGAMLALNVLVEGITPKGMARSVHFLDLRTATEIALDEVAVFAPTLYHTTVRAPTEGTLLPIPLADDYRHSPHYQLSSDNLWQTVDGVIPVRQRRLLGARTLSPAQGRLVITDHTGGLRVENHLPGTLASLLIWKDGVGYRFGALRRGEAAVAQPASSAGRDKGIPTPPEGLVLAEAWPLFDSLQKGELGGRYFIGTLLETDLERFPLPVGFRQLNAGKHVIAGLY